MNEEERDRLLGLIYVGLQHFLGDHEGTPLDQTLTAGIMERVVAAVNEFASTLPAAENAETPAVTSGYATALGAYIIQQNPYCSEAQLVLPKIPNTPNGERPWVRKSGLLRNNTTLDPLPGDVSIPAGPIVDFPYEDWKYLQETGPGHTDRYTEREPGTQDPYPPDFSTHYSHHAVKTVRLRYTIKERRWKDGTGPDQPAGTKPDREAGYILVVYSGSDS